MGRDTEEHSNQLSCDSENGVEGIDITEEILQTSYMYVTPVAVAVDDDGGFDKKGNRRRGCAPKYVLHIKPLRQADRDARGSRPC